jgi:hypothetical protein
MKIPESVQIGGHVYKVDLGWLPERGSTRVGEVNHDTHIIGVLRRPSQSAMEETFIHEVVHAVDLVYNNSALGEDEVDALSQGLYQALKGILGE